MKALSNAKETFLRLNQDGMLCVQHLMESGTGVRNFVDFLIQADEDDYGEGEDDMTDTQSSQPHPS
jgi:hypothetical protein